jgi:hypothetical protein
MACLGPASRGFVLLLVLLLVAAPSLLPRRVTLASAPPDISGERAMAHLPIIAREPHPAGSPAQARVRDYLVRQLSDIGLEVEVQRTRGVENVVACLHGTDPTGAIVVLAHYDSVAADAAGSGRAASVTVPALPSTVIVCPLRMRLVATPVAITAGMPYSRAKIEL